MVTMETSNTTSPGYKTLGMDEFDVLMGGMRRIQHTDQGHPSMDEQIESS
jgi:hypothetical protein